MNTLKLNRPKPKYNQQVVETEAKKGLKGFDFLFLGNGMFYTPSHYSFI